MVLAAIAFGAALCALAALWAWQAWSTRSSEPIDDLLPLLTVDGLATEDGVELGEPVQDPTGAEAGETLGGEAQAGSAFPSPAAVIPAPDTDPSNQPAAPPPLIIVHISGAVTDPGVVEISSEARVFQAVGMAGGATVLADLDRVNLAAPMVDGERIHVPAEGEDVPPELAHDGGLEQPAEAVAGEPVVIDINTASVDDLESLPGIGPSIAAAIVQTRLDRGPFLSVEELLEVPGIGEAKLSVISPFVTVSG